MTDTSKIIWDFLKSKGLSDYAIAGLMGNLYAESKLQSVILETLYSKKFNMTSQQYTEAVDNYTYTNFTTDRAGYGLAQWTAKERKQKLFHYAYFECRVSIGDLMMQLNFLWRELQDYKIVIKTMGSAKSVREVSDCVLKYYENPADQSEAVKIKRASFGQKYYDMYAEKIIAKPTLKLNSKGDQVKYLQDNLNNIMGSSLEVDGIMGSKTVKVLKEFQSKYNLVIDGIYGQNSYSKMKSLI